MCYTIHIRVYRNTYKRQTGGETFSHRRRAFVYVYIHICITSHTRISARENILLCGCRDRSREKPVIIRRIAFFPARCTTLSRPLETRRACLLSMDDSFNSIWFKYTRDLALCGLNREDRKFAAAVLHVALNDGSRANFNFMLYAKDIVVFPFGFVDAVVKMRCIARELSFKHMVYGMLV